jgi:hypothetical protein
MLHSSLEPTLASEGNISTLPIGSRIKYQVYNDSDRPVYLILLGLDSSRNAIAFYPLELASETKGAEIKPLLKTWSLLLAKP